MPPTLFFSSSHGGHPDLHSFPTRRSSDLRLTLGHAPGHRQRIHTEPVRFAAHVALRLQDRKSTRLNSSHANISYAVFCLKKKKLFDMLVSRRYDVFLRAAVEILEEYERRR